MVTNTKLEDVALEMARLGVKNPRYTAWVAAVMELASQHNLLIIPTGSGAINSVQTVFELVKAGVPAEQIIAVAALVKA